MLPHFLDSLRKALPKPLPNMDHRKTYAIELAYGRYRGPAPIDAQHAAVLVLLHINPAAKGGVEPSLSDYHFPLTLRVPQLTRHGGQISLPGGRQNRDESPWQAAVREAEEELGVGLSDIVTIGELTTTYVYVSNFLVTPYVAFLPFTPTWRAQESEVAEIFEMSLMHLIHPDHFSMPLRERHGVVFRSPCIEHTGHQIWGATGLILGELIEKIRTALSNSAAEKENT